MWHDDNWQPWAEHNAPSAVTANNNSWRRNYAYHNGGPAGMGRPMARPPYNVPMHPGRPMPYARPMPHHPQPLLPGGSHPANLAAANQELSWRTMNDGWGIAPPPHFRHPRPRNPFSPPWVHPMAAAANGHEIMTQPAVEITTPHAGGELRARPIATRKSSPDVESLDFDGSGDHRKKELYSDFSEPTRPKTIVLKHEASAVKIIVSWTFPDLPMIHKYVQKIEVFDEAKLTTLDDKLAPHITSYKFKAIPGEYYVVTLTVVDDKECVVATGEERCKAVFSMDEMHKLMNRSLDYCGTTMQPFTHLYRCKPKVYWDDIYFRTHGIVERYMKDKNGQAASPINDEIADGSLPPSSPFGDIRMILPAISLLDPTRVSFFFCDFYCNRIVHYVTVVVCERGSKTEEFCQEKLIPLQIENNRFLKIVPSNNPAMPYHFYANKSVWVEIYYTESIPMSWGRFDHIMPTGAGTSKIGGLPHNKSCLTCNLYPIGPAAGGHVEPVEDLVATYEGQLTADEQNTESNQLFPRNSTRYTTLGCIQAELVSPSNDVNATIGKEDFMQIGEVLVYCVDRVVFEENYSTLKRFNALGDDESRSNQEQKITEPEVNRELKSGTAPANSELKPALKCGPKREVEKEEDDVQIIEPSEAELSTRSCGLLKMLERIEGSGNSEGETAATATVPPVVATLVLKLRSLVKEMDRGFADVNALIDRETVADVEGGGGDAKTEDK